MSTATCTPEVRGSSLDENATSGEPGSEGNRVEATGNGAAEAGRSPDAARPAADSTRRAAATGRDAKGRFGPGNVGGPGNPFARQLAKFRSFIMNCNTEEHMTFAFNMMMQMIADGNVGALKLYFLYIIGKPADAVDPDKLDLDEWNGYRSTAGMVDEATALMKAPASDLPLALLRIGKAAVTQSMRDFAVHNIEHPEELLQAKAEAARKQQEEMEKARQRLHETATAVWPGLPAGAAPVVKATGGTPVLRQPSANGGNGQADPRGSQSLTPRLDGDAPSSNGGNGQASPSTNGGNGQADPRGSQSLTPRLEPGQPSANGGNGEAAVAEALAAEFEAILGRLGGARPAA